MARRLLVSSVVGIALLASAGARAGTLTSASWFQTTPIGRVGLGILVPLTRTSNALGATGTSTATSIAVSLSYPFTSINFFVPKTPNGTLDVAVHLTQGGPQLITATPGMGAGTPGIPGTQVVRTAAHNNRGVNQSMFKVGVNTLVQVPLSHGKAGLFTNTFTVTGALHVNTLVFYAWTPGTLTFTGLTSKSAPMPSVVAMGSFDLTPHGGGTVTLVSPSRFDTDGSLGSQRSAYFTKLVLTFVPEPGTLLLLAGGAVAGLLALGWERPR